MTVYASLLLFTVQEMFPFLEWVVDDKGLVSTAHVQDYLSKVWVMPVVSKSPAGFYNIDYQMWVCACSILGDGPAVSVTDKSPKGIFEALAKSVFEMHIKQRTFTNDDPMDDIFPEAEEED